MKIDRIRNDYAEARHNFDHWPNDYSSAIEQLDLLQKAYDTAILFFHSNDEFDVDDQTFYRVVCSLLLNLQLERSVDQCLGNPA